jgi:hypothetical protein
MGFDGLMIDELFPNFVFENFRLDLAAVISKLGGASCCIKN